MLKMSSVSLGCAWLMCFNLLTEREKPQIYGCGKLPTPGLDIPEIVQTFGLLDDGFGVHHFRHILASVSVAQKESLS